MLSMGRSCNPRGAHVPSGDRPRPVPPMPSSVGRGGRLLLPFLHVKFWGEEVFSTADPSPFPSPILCRARGTKRLSLGGGARTVAGFPTVGGQEPATLTGLLRAQHHPLCQAQGGRGGPGQQPPQGRNVAAHPLQFSAPPAHLPPKVLQTRTSFSPLDYRARDRP